MSEFYMGDTFMRSSGYGGTTIAYNNVDRDDWCAMGANACSVGTYAMGVGSHAEGYTTTADRGVSFAKRKVNLLPNVGKRLCRTMLKTI